MIEIDLHNILKSIDEVNAKDPNTESWEGKLYPKELLYSQRMSACLHQYFSTQDPALIIATRAQHIARWKIPRIEYPMDRKGYLLWRSTLKRFHVEQTTKILQTHEVPQSIIDRCSTLLLKKNLKGDAGVQTLEDVVCLVFLQFYLEPFTTNKSEEKINDILRKTWKKMSESSRAIAMNLELSPKLKVVIEHALIDN